MAEKTIKGYRILRLIGRGGMAAIYLAENIATAEKVAMKVLLPHIASDRDYVLRFLHEVRANKRLDHRNIVKIIDCDEVRGNYFMAMEFVDGITLQELIRTIVSSTLVRSSAPASDDMQPNTHMPPVMRIPLSCTLYILREILEGLSFSHQRNIVHRDIKPSNILLSRTGEVKISDFGISKTTEFTNLTQTGSVLGTPAYMSPEQAKGNPVDCRSDIFSTGVMLYELLTGTNPFYSDNPSSAILNILQCHPESPSDSDPTLSPDLEALVERMIAKDPAVRFSSASEVIDELEKIEMVEGGGIAQAQFKDFIADPVNKSIELFKSKSLLHFDLARGFEAKGKDFALQALWEYYKAVQLDATNLEARIRLEKLAALLGYNLQPKKSLKIQELEMTLEQNPNNIAVLMQVAKRHRIEGNFFEVLKFYKKLKKLKPNDCYLQAQIESLVGDQTLARQVTSVYWKTDESPTSSHISSAVQRTIPRFDVIQVKAPAKASRGNVKVIATVLTFCVTIALAWFLLGRSISHMNTMDMSLPEQGNSMDSSDLLRHDQNQTELNPEAGELFNQAENAYNRKDYQMAKELLEQFQTRFPKDRTYAIMMKLAETERQLGNHIDALNHLDRIIYEQPNAVLAVYARKERASIYSMQKNYFEAETEYENLMDSLDRFPEVEQRVQCLIDYSMYLRSRKNYEHAFSVATKILDDFQGVEFARQARKLRVQILLDEKKHTQALDEYYELIEIVPPESPDYQPVRDNIKLLEKNLKLPERVLDQSELW